MQRNCRTFAISMMGGCKSKVQPPPYAQLAVERDTLAELTSLMADHDAMKRDQSVLADEHDAMKHEHAALTDTHTTLTSDHNSIVSCHALLVKSHAAQTAELQATHDLLASAQARADRASCDLRKERAAHDSLRGSVKTCALINKYSAQYGLGGYYVTY